MRRKITLPHLHRAVQFLRPLMPEIEEALKGSPFSDDLPEFLRMRERVPADLRSPWDGLTVERYLNDADQREFRIAGR